MVCRYGATEIRAIIGYLNYTDLSFPQKQWHKYIKREAIGAPNWIKNMMYIYSGVFPPTENTLKKFSELMLNDSAQVDLLASWRPEELRLKKYLSNNFISIPLDSLTPFLFNNPWSKALEGKKVLVIHPFEKSITEQYKNSRKLLFKNPDVLPEFQLKTIKAVQSIAGTTVPFSDWFEALDYMKKEIDSVDYDIALIGAGAYGFPLAAHIKRQKKKAIHVGGALQLLFGIKGSRWKKDKNIQKHIIAENWISPNNSETPQGIEKVENACYW